MDGLREKSGGLVRPLGEHGITYIKLVNEIIDGCGIAREILWGLGHGVLMVVGSLYANHELTFLEIFKSSFAQKS